MGSAEARIAVVVAYCPAPHVVDEVALSLPAHATVGDALRESGLAARHLEIERDALKLGVWGKLREPGDPLREGDRVEVYRPLKVDPKEARRQRYRRDGVRRRAKR